MEFGNRLSRRFRLAVGARGALLRVFEWSGSSSDFWNCGTVGIIILVVFEEVVVFREMVLKWVR